MAKQGRMRGWLAVAVAVGGVSLALATAESAPAEMPRDRLALRLPAAPGAGRKAPAMVFHLDRRADLARLVQAADERIELSRRQQAEREAERTRLLAGRSLADLTLAELGAYFAERRGVVSRHERRGWEQIRRRAAAALEAPDARASWRTEMLELGGAIANAHRQPFPQRLGFFEVPLTFFDYWHNPIARGVEPATNLERQDAPDSSRVDPRPSTFWQRPPDIGSQDLYAGFGRAARPDFETPLWEYAGPKTTAGGVPGFEAVHGPVRIKIKFGETVSEPFTARVFAALGYHVESVDHAAAVRIKYDRRLFREFHLRRNARVTTHVFGLRVYTFDFQRRFDPFEFIAAALMKDGTRLSGPAFKLRLFRGSREKHPEDQPANFDPAVEAAVDHLVTVAANVQVKEDEPPTVGPWDFGQLGHDGLRELRGAGLLAAWLCWRDSRFANTKLKLVAQGGRLELRHYITDLGGGLGRGTGITPGGYESPNEFAWTFTKPRKVQGRGRMTVPFRIAGYRPFDDTPAFAAMTYDDARWMARLISQLTEEQLVGALIASGLDAARVRLYTEKLAGRRDRMIRDLGLAAEIPLMRPEGVQRDLSYDPGQDGGLTWSPGGGRAVAAPVGAWQVRRGRLVPREAALGGARK